MTLVVTAIDVDETRSLYDWLSLEPELGGATVEWERHVVRPGEMGALSDALLVIFGASGVGTMFVQSVLSWLKSRPADVKVRFRSHKGSFDIDGRRVQDPAALLRDVSRLVDDET